MIDEKSARLQIILGKDQYEEGSKVTGVLRLEVLEPLNPQ